MTLENRRGQMWYAIYEFMIHSSPSYTYKIIIRNYVTLEKGINVVCNL